MNKRLRVAINAQVRPGGGLGGVVTVLRALAALAGLDGPEEYVFVGPHDSPEWLRSILPPGQTVVPGPAPVEWSIDRMEPLKRALGPLRPAARGLRRILNTTVQTAKSGASVHDSLKFFAPAPPKSFYEAMGFDVVHFPFLSYEPCGLPAVYNPHDLQHLHYPEFFDQADITWRETLYPSACRAAHTVVVASEFVRRDVVERYRIDSRKVQVIPWAPPPLPESHPAEDFSALRSRYGLSERPFALYPAMTWEHKNHVRLLEALARLRDRDGPEIRFVFTGHKTHFWPRVERRVNELGLAGQVRFLGLIPHEELSTLYRAAQFVFVPTLFEAASAPLFEAWQHGVPVACSAVTSLPEQAAGAALLFDPFDVEAIARALRRMATEEVLRDELRRSGARRLDDFSLERTAKAYRAVYRRAAGLRLCDEDRRLLGWDWMRGGAPGERPDSK
ncbi:MAG TPA: glycosyltransferase family 1 protein [Pyrinomonadaceae bacterium]